MRTKKSRLTAVAAGISALALLFTGCGSSSSDSASTASANEGGEIVARGCQPQNDLIGGDTGESCGHDIVELITSTLFRYDPETTQPSNDLADSVETDDNQNFTVTIKPDLKFSNGEALTAKSFVDAWNYTAYSPNGQYLSYFFEPIKGFADLQAPAEGKKPKAKAMSGLKVVDDTTFTIETTEPVSNLAIRLGYTAFAAQPESFFTDHDNYVKLPAASGPYKLESYTPNRSAVLVKNPEYGGDAAKGNVDKITFKIYKESTPAYNDLLAGNLDTIDEIPTSAIVDRQFEKDLDGRFVDEAYPAIQTVVFAPEKTSPDLKNPKLRQAISMAIDRQKVIDDQFDGLREPATGWNAPGTEGFQGDACGEYCEYNPEMAKQLFDEAGGYDGKLTIAYNGDSDHKGWVEATCNSIKKVLGVECLGKSVVDFATFRDQIGAQELTGMFRSGWLADYPHIENFLTPLYATGASSNDGAYSNPEFDKLLVEAGKAEGDESVKLYQDAEKMLAEGMPAIPMWYYAAQAGYSEKLDNVRLNKSTGRIDLLNVTVK